jgi:predicted TIM-barrel fold metal-dependent hydrolase
MLEPAPTIDVNVTLGQWPTRRVPCDELGKLIEKLHAHNVTEAWVSDYDALFDRDLTDVNNRLAAICNNSSSVKLVPFGSVNPSAANWQAELDRCSSVRKMHGIRLYPNYHNYKLDHPDFVALLRTAAERNLIVQLAVVMEDARMMHPLMRVQPVDTAPLEKHVSQIPNLKLILLNALTTASRTDQLYRLLNVGNVYVEIAVLETMAALESLLKDIPAGRILFGSHAPSFYHEAAHLKLIESNLPAATLTRIRSDNARQLLAAQN